MRPWWAWVLVFAAGVGVGLIAKTPAGCRAYAYPVQELRAEKAADHLAERREQARTHPGFESGYLLAVALIREREARLLRDTQYATGFAPFHTRSEDLEIERVLTDLRKHAKTGDQRRICTRLDKWLRE